MPAENFDSNRLLERIHGKDSDRDVVLFVEADRMLIKIAKALGEQSFPGYKIEIAENPEIALKQISNKLRGRIALVFIPSQSGPSLATSLRVSAGEDVLRDMKYVPIIFSSFSEDYQKTETTKGYAINSLLDGVVDAFVMNPLGLEMIKKGTHEAVDRIKERKDDDALNEHVFETLNAQASEAH